MVAAIKSPAGCLASFMGQTAYLIYKDCCRQGLVSSNSSCTVKSEVTTAAVIMIKRGLTDKAYAVAAWVLLMSRTTLLRSADHPSDRWTAVLPRRRPC